MKLCLTVKEAAHELGMSEGWVKAQIRSGELGSVKFGRSRRIWSGELERFIASKNVGTPAVHSGSLASMARRDVIEKTVGVRR